MATTKSKITRCDECVHLAIDEETGEEFCEMPLDEDEMYRFLSGQFDACPFYHGGSGDYYLSKKQ
ncbi:MAG: hypothetical protein IIV78_04170 [Oscillospiraceae bacterium]|nr:hypothetical protein [Oscillospiraceae bacterium]MBQ5739586.1 hypothetical protein [Oscillospiraceae bacterium]